MPTPTSTTTTPTDMRTNPGRDDVRSPSAAAPQDAFLVGLHESRLSPAPSQAAFLESLHESRLSQAPRLVAPSELPPALAAPLLGPALVGTWDYHTQDCSGLREVYTKLW